MVDLDNDRDSLAILKRRGADRFEALLKQSGGVITSDEFAAAEGSTEEMLSVLIAQNKLLAIRTGAGWRLPLIQFMPGTYTVWSEIQGLMTSVPDALHESVFRFLASRVHPPEDTETPAQKIQNRAISEQELVRGFIHRYEMRG